MGLDQMAFSREIRGDSDFYWRKHPNLQGWMENLWDERTNRCFNCVEVHLTKENIEELREAVINEDLPNTEGFFFGEDSDEEYKEQDLAFCEWALKEIEEGREVFYDSWWQTMEPTDKELDDIMSSEDMEDKCPICGCQESGCFYVGCLSDEWGNDET